MIMGWAEWLEETPLAYFIQGDLYAFPLLEVLHVVSIALVVGTIFIVDLRLLNWCSKSYQVTRLLRAMLPLTLGAFGFAAVTGFLMFSSQPTRYLETPVFLLKMGLLLLAAVNMAIFHVWTQRGIAQWDTEGAVPLSARTAGLISMVLWVAILVAGRFVGFLL